MNNSTALLTDFDAILDECIRDLIAKRATIDTCLARHPDHAEHLRSLLQVADRVSQIPSLPPLPAEKRRALEARVFERVDRSRPAVRQPDRVVARRTPFWRRSFALVAAILVVCILASVTAVTASAASLPGEILYPVKRLTEQAAVVLTPPTGQATLHLELAQRRLAEFSTLAKRGDVHPELLADISTDTKSVLDNSKSLPSDQQQTVLSDLAQFSGQQLDVLASMSAKAPDAVREKLQNAATDTASTREKALGLLKHDNQPGNNGKGQNDHGNAAPTAAASTATDSAGPTQDTPEAADTPSDQTTPNSGHTPPGQATPNPEQVPPVQATPNPGHTPPGQATPKPEHTPPGQATQDAQPTPQEQSPPNPEDTPEPGHTPPGQATPKPGHTPPGQGNPNPPSEPPGQSGDNNGKPKK